MALIVEDGTIVAGADTYVSRADVIAYALKRGVAITDDDTADVKIIKAMDYLSYFDAKWKGEQVDPSTQSLAWPREYVYIGYSSEAFPSDEIPAQLVRAVCELTMQVNNGVELLPTTTASTSFIKREKVDVIETEYSEAMALSLLGSLPDMPLVEAMLKPLFNNGGFGSLRTVRI